MKEYKQVEEEKAKRIYRKIGIENGVEIEISKSKNMDLTFVVRGKRVNVDQAKRSIIACFQTQVNYLQSSWNK